MKTGSLTAKQVEHMKAEPGKRIAVAAGPPTGLYLVIYPTGSKSWTFRYRFNGKTRKLTYKPYPEMSLAAARAEAESAIAELEENRDPGRTKANEDAAAQRESEAETLVQESVSNVVAEFIKREVRPKENKTADRIIRREAWKETERILNRETTAWKNRTIGDIAKPDVLRLLDGIVDRGASVMACRTRGVLMRLFDWAQGRGYIEESPMIGVKKPGPDNRDRERALEPNELAEVWNAAEGLGYPLGPYTRFLILTAQRRGEVATMRWRDVDLEKKLWTIPAEATKNGRVHDVPLSEAAIETIKDLPRFTKGDYLFTTTSGAKPINAFSKAKTRLDDAILNLRKESAIAAGVKVDKVKNLEAWTWHDIRRTSTTLMAPTVPVHVLSAILNHSLGKLMGITKIYNRYSYMPERREALQKWSEFVLSLTDESAAKAVNA
jgi:integrase